MGANEVASCALVFPPRVAKPANGEGSGIVMTTHFMGGLLLLHRDLLPILLPNFQDGHPAHDLIFSLSPPIFACWPEKLTAFLPRTLKMTMLHCEGTELKLACGAAPRIGCQDFTSIEDILSYHCDLTD
jgi:hypothetical protein